jgi:hypothetical protein
MFRGFEDLNSIVRPKMLIRGEPRRQPDRSKATVRRFTVFNLTQDKRTIDSDVIRPPTQSRAKASPGRRGQEAGAASRRCPEITTVTYDLSRAAREVSGLPVMEETRVR